MLTGDRHQAGDVVQEISGASEQLVNRHQAVTALSLLTREHRDVLRERYFRGSTVAEAAHALRLAIEELASVR